MTPEKDWDQIRGRSTPIFGTVGSSILIRVTLLFGSAAVALALVLAPAAERYAQGDLGMDGVDFISTGSIRNSGTARSYTIHRSVLQQPGAVCIIHANGTTRGDC